MSQPPLRAMFMAALVCVGASAPVLAAEPRVNLYNWFGLIAPETPKEFEQKTGTRMHMDAFEHDPENLGGPFELIQIELKR